jgi:hypothetical protein
MKLSIAGQQRASTFIKSKARPLEQARYSYHFENASRTGAIQALAACQNADGGFGHGLEPDLPMNESSVIATTRGLQVLTEVGAPADHPLVRGAIGYLLATYDPQTGVWEIVPRAANNGPHAPWWHYDDDGQTGKWGGYLVNPRAEVLGCLYDYSALVPARLLQDVADSVIGHLDGVSDLRDMHDIGCYLTLAETRSLPAKLRSRLLDKLEPAVVSVVERDPARWEKYCLKPIGYMGVVRSPASPFARLFATEVEAGLDYEIEHQHADGSWLPTWSWGASYPEAWERAKQDWQGILTVQTLKTLADFGRLESA